jgi:hypothetical protein
MTDQTLRVQTWQLPTKNGPQRLDAIRLATGSSHEKLHTHLTDHAEKREKCHACRWYEIAIYRTRDTYVVHTAGRSTVPGEETWYRVVRAPRPSDVIDALVVERDRGDHVERFITRPAQDALDYAATLDDQLNAVLAAWMASEEAASVQL